MNVSLAIISAILYPDLRDPAQSFLGSLIAFLLIGLAFLPCAVIAVAIVLVANGSYLTAAAAASAANVLVGSAGIAVAGILFRRYDPTSE